MTSHPHVPHPYTALRRASASFHDRFLTWMTSKVLASVIMFDVALVAPLVVLPMPDSVKLLLAVISSNWIQWWALPALQRSQIKADEKRDAKADADHQAMTHMASTLDRIEAMLTSAKGGTAG
jgi:hypothetical protein